MEDWKIFRGTGSPHEGVDRLPAPPSWRAFSQPAPESSEPRKDRGATFQPRQETIEVVNAALYLRRPLLVTGKPGTGKTSLAYAVAHELQLGEVLYWPITTKTDLKQGLYSYDAIGRLQDAQSQGGKDNLADIGNYFPANAFSLYDMHGNVWEWCQDHYHNSYEDAPTDGSPWVDLEAKEDSRRVLRGGSWINVPAICRSALRNVVNPGVRINVIGFRVLCLAPGL